MTGETSTLCHFAETRNPPKWGKRGRTGQVSPGKSPSGQPIEPKNHQNRRQITETAGGTTKTGGKSLKQPQNHRNSRKTGKRLENRLKVVCGVGKWWSGWEWEAIRGRTVAMLYHEQVFRTYVTLWTMIRFQGRVQTGIWIWIWIRMLSICGQAAAVHFWTVPRSQSYRRDGLYSATHTDSVQPPC